MKGKDNKNDECSSFPLICGGTPNLKIQKGQLNPYELGKKFDPTFPMYHNKTDSNFHNPT